MLLVKPMPMVKHDHDNSHMGMRIEGRMNLSCVIWAGMLPTMMPRANQVLSQLRSLP